MKESEKGFSLVELVITVGIILIVLSIAVPSFQESIETEQLKEASESLASDIQFARSEAIKKNADVFVAFREGDNWCYGLNDAATCDCNEVNACKISGVEKVVKASSFPSVTFEMTGFGLDTGDTRLEGTRGTASRSGTIRFAKGTNAIQVEVNVLGRVRVCSSTVVGYEPC